MEQSSLNPRHLADSPRIYVASLADYNSGRPHGRWIDADQPAGAVREQIAEMLRQSKEPMAGQWVIHDYKGFGDLHLSKHEKDIDRIAEAAFLIKKHGPVFASLLKHLGGIASIDKARHYMEHAYLGEYNRLSDYAIKYVWSRYRDVLENLPDLVRHNISYEGVANKMWQSGYVFTIKCDGQIHVFDARK